MLLIEHIRTNTIYGVIVFLFISVLFLAPVMTHFFAVDFQAGVLCENKTQLSTQSMNSHVSTLIDAS